MNVKFRPWVLNDMLTVSQHIGYSPMDTTRGIVAYDQDTAETVAVFLIDSWTETSAQIHQIILKTMVIRHGWFETVAEFMFTAAARLMVYATVPANNTKALSLNKKIGFHEVTRLKDAWAKGVDFVVMEMTREDCNYWVPAKLQKVS